MSGRTRTNLTALIALLALVVACGGTAVAAGLAKDSVTSKSIKNNAVKSKDIKNETVQSADVKDGTLTGADIAEGTLGVVPDATAVGGVKVTALSVSLPSGAAEVTVLSESGATLGFDCGGSSIVLVYSRTATGAPIVITSNTSPNGTFTESLSTGESVTSNQSDGHYKATIVLPTGGSLTAEFAGVYEVNADGVNDCFYRGTITRVP